MYVARIVIAVAIAAFLGAGSAAASSQYKKAVYPSRVERGTLQVQAPSTGGWGARWVDVAPRGAKLVQEMACGVGPVFVVVDARGAYSLRAFNWKNGALLWSKSTGTTRPSLLSASSFGVRFSVGKDFYSSHHGALSGPFKK